MLTRRVFLKATTATSVLSLAAATGLLGPRTVLAKPWPETAFRSKSERDAIGVLFPGARFKPSKDIQIIAPTLAENNMLVPVTVKCSLPSLKSITLICVKNPHPLAVSFQMAPALHGELKVRVKMIGSSDIKVIVESEDKFYTAKRFVKVTAGGCGG